MRAGIDYYLPELQETVRSVVNGTRTREFRRRPLFPGYLFAHTEDGQWHALLRTFGVIGIVMGTNKEPGIVFARELASIRAREEGGVIRLPKRRFVRDQEVEIRAGSHMGFYGLVDGYSGPERVRVLLDYMGRKVPFLIDQSKLEAA